MRLPRPIEKRVAQWRRRRPPRVRKGWKTGPPDFVGIGAQRAGTTWWHELVMKHPDVYGPRVKELHFFGGRNVLRNPKKAKREYAAQFPRPPGGIAGEWTPYYMNGKRVPEQLAALAPDAKILVALRDPVDRYRSGSSRRPDKAEDAVNRGLYASQLAAFLEHFPRERFLVLQYELCVRDPAPHLRRTYEFLGVDPDFVPKRFDAKGSRSFGAGEELDPSLKRKLIRKYEPEVQRLSELGFDIDLSAWPNFAHLA